MHSNLLSQLAALALKHSAMIATAESCTGGMIAAALTELSGSSAWFDRGYVTYSNEAKMQMLGVMRETIDGQGAVSAAAVAEMSQGALARSNATLTVAVSGVAGPTGGTDAKPVGTVWIAWASETSGALTRHYQFSGDRDAVREQTVSEALKGLIACIDSESM